MKGPFPEPAKIKNEHVGIGKGPWTRAGNQKDVKK